MSLATRMTVAAMFSAFVYATGPSLANDAPVERIGVYGLDKQRISGETSVTAPGSGFLRRVAVTVTINHDGKVVEAQVDDENREHLDPAPALAAARQWRFKPQTFDGRPVDAVGSIFIYYRSPETSPTPAPFPPNDASTTEIKLERSACFGSCPDYAVVIRGDGSVRFSTHEENFPGTAAAVHREFNGDSVLWPGVHETRVDPARVVALVDAFRAASFFGLKPAYVAEVTDNPTYALTLRIGGATKRVQDYVGESVGMPAAVTALEKAVDALAGTDRWITGTPAMLPLLEAEGFDFHSARAAELTAAVASRPRYGEQVKQGDALVRTLIDRGVPLDAFVTARRRGKLRLGALLALQAADNGDETLFKRLSDKGYLDGVTSETLSNIFASGMGCSPTIARAMTKAGADSVGKAAKDRIGGGTALTALRGTSDVCGEASEAQRVAMAETLLSLGVPIEGRDDIDWTPLMGCDSPALARLLLAHGANPNAHDEDGNTPLLATDDDRVALILLRAGANPRVKTNGGTVRQQAIKQHMPATLDWLDRHGVP